MIMIIHDKFHPIMPNGKGGPGVNSTVFYSFSCSDIASLTLAGLGVPLFPITFFIAI